MTRRRWLGVALFAVAAGCAPETADPASGAVPREGRFGSLRDFVLIERSGEGRPEAFFVDRFEVTRADWAQFAATPAARLIDAASVITAGEPALPVAGVDLRQARAFARWRFARLPSRQEWEAAVGDGRHPYPWGSRGDWTRANAGELGLGQATPVGTFESGRAGAGQPYDLIGNVSEWTESVSLAWFDADGLDPASVAVAWRRVVATPAVSPWHGPGGLVPLAYLVAAGGDRVPREVVGADFQTSMTVLLESVAAGDRRARTGLRIYCTPRELLAALLAPGVEASERDLEQVRAFVRREDHRGVLAAALRGLAPPASRSPVLRVLRDELGG